MKGVVLCGGKGTRLLPLTQTTNKSLLPVYNKLVIFYAIETLVKSGIKEVVLVTGGADVGDFLRNLRDGTQFGLHRLEYTYHEPQTGVLDALYLARHFIEGRPAFVIMADNITDEDFTRDVTDFKTGAKLFLKRVSDPKRFGIPHINQAGQIVKLEEKPKNPNSPLIATGIYLYDTTLFKKIETILNHNPRANISSLNQLYLKDRQLDWREIKAFWVDIGTIPDLFHANYHFAKKAGWKYRPPQKP